MQPRRNKWLENSFNVQYQINSHGISFGTLKTMVPAPPHFPLMVSPAQTVRDSGLKTFMDVYLGITTGVIQAILEFPPLRRDIVDFSPPRSAPLTPYISAQGWKFRNRLDHTSSDPKVNIHEKS